MQIRQAQISEAPLLSSLAYASKAHWPYSSDQLEVWRNDLTITANMIRSCPVYVAETGTEIAGVFVLAPSTPRWSLEHFWVSPAHMGRGIGKALLSYAARLAEQAGADVLDIDADPYAEGFYLACGAERVGSIKAPIAGEPERVRPQLILNI